MFGSTHNLRLSIIAKPGKSVEKGKDNKPTHHTVWWRPEGSPENKHTDEKKKVLVVREQKTERDLPMPRDGHKQEKHTEKGGGQEEVEV